MKNIIFGLYNIEYYLNSKIDLIINSYFSIKIKDIYNSKKIKNIFERLKKNKIPINFVSRKYLIKNFIKKNINESVCIKIKNDISYSFNKNIFIKKIKEKNPIFIILENINDSRNLGSCIRNADAFGIKLIFITKRSSSINYFVKKTSSGSINNINIMRINSINYIVKILKKYNIKIIGASNKSNNIIFKNNLKPPIAFVFGSENLGIKEKTQKNCDKIIKIPMYGYVNSLNLSVSVGICLLESIRQMNFV